MKPNRIRQLLAEGKVPVGHMIWEFSTRGVAKIIEAAGADFVLIDMEHSGFHFGQVNDLLSWFKATPVTPIVRVPAAEYHFIARVMDAGAHGVMVPNVSTAEQARAVVNAMRYAPEGGRGLGLGGLHNDFVAPDPVKYMAEANRNNIFLCQIESTTGLENLDAIAGTPGVDVLWVGHFDLTQSMGIVGQFHHPDFLAALKKVVATAKKYNIATGIQPKDPTQAREWLDLGFSVISYGADSGVYGGALKAGVEAVRALQ
jgi:2-dehydro-3-deoxyglucarate aldolase/4-hydroxy-2-oxoheptanedioate aldolase